MKRRSFTQSILASALFSSAAGTASASNSNLTQPDVATQAFVLMLGLVRQNEQNAVRAARALSYLAVALHEAHRAGVGPQGLGQVAGRVLGHFFPRVDPALLSAWVAGWVGGGGAPDASAHAVAERVITRSMADGAQARWSPRMRPQDFAGIWQPTYPMFAVVPLEGMAPGWRHWVAPGSARYVPPTAHRPGSAQHSAETQEVLAVAKTLTLEQRERAQWWNLDAGSVTPAGVWLRLALQMMMDGAQPMPQGQRLAVLRDLCTAMHDAFIACWSIKLRDWSERPITAIRRSLDADFVPVVVTPGHPSYVSGHATVSGAAATVLAAHWPAEQGALWAKAEEAANSRLWGAIHFRSDNEEGLKLGRAVGQDVLAQAARWNAGEGSALDPAPGLKAGPG